MSLMQHVLLQLPLHDIIKLFVLDRNKLRPIIYNILPGLVTKEGVDVFCQQLINLNEKELLKKTVNQLYQIDHDIVHYVNILPYQDVFLYILPNYELPNLLPTILKNKNEQFILHFLTYSIHYKLFGYLREIVQIKTNNIVLSDLIKDAKIILDVNV